MGLNATTISVARPNKEGAPCLFFFFSWGSSQAFADRLAEALTSQVFKETKTMGRAPGEGREASCEEEWPAKWERRHIERDRVGEKKKHIEPMERYNLLTIWLGGWQQPSSVFLELYKTPNYSVRKIKESQRAVEWKKKRAKLSQWGVIVEKVETLQA